MQVQEETNQNKNNFTSVFKSRENEKEIVSAIKKKEEAPIYSYTKS